MSYSVHPVTLHALMRDGQATPVAVYHTAWEAQAAAEMLAEHESRTDLVRSAESFLAS
jgi:hypothetical protein